FHQNILVAHLTPGRPAYQMLLQQAQALLVARGIHPAAAAHAAMALLYSIVQRQASYASYTDVFRVFAWIGLAASPCVWFMRKPRTGGGARAAH
ncbi:MAG: hypothetical protein ACRD1L_12960, partial [Terriglobales bacterium]